MPSGGIFNIYAKRADGTGETTTLLDSVAAILHERRPQADGRRRAWRRFGASGGNPALAVQSACGNGVFFRDGAQPGREHALAVSGDGRRPADSRVVRSVTAGARNAVHSRCELACCRREVVGAPQTRRGGAVLERIVSEWGSVTDSGPATFPPRISSSSRTVPSPI